MTEEKPEEKKPEKTPETKPEIKKKPQTPETQVEIKPEHKPKKPETTHKVTVHPTKCPFCKGENIGYDKTVNIYKCLECGRYWQR